MALGRGAPARVFLARRKEVAPCSVTANADIYVCSSRKAKQHTVLFLEYLARPSTSVIYPQETKKRWQTFCLPTFFGALNRSCAFGGAPR